LDKELGTRNFTRTISNEETGVDGRLFSKPSGIAEDKTQQQGNEFIDATRRTAPVK
jgi:hypothetical protein